MNVCAPTSGQTPPRVIFGRAVLGELVLGREREWLVTNGAGAFACGTLPGLNTRRYHGLLVAALRPPVARTLALAKVCASVRYLGRDFELDVNEYADGTVHPQGHHLLEGFALEGTVPKWTWALADALLECRVYMARGRNTSYVAYRLARASAPIELALRPLTAWRDYHSHQHGGWRPQWQSDEDGCAMSGGWGSLRLTAAGARFAAEADWHWNFRHSVEAARGLDATEDLYSPGAFRATLSPGQTLTLVATTDDGPAPDPAAALAEVRAHEADLLARVPASWPAWVRGLALAADQFVVARPGAADGSTGSTVIAGYPWFTDWGRDTMIALPGLALATGRPAIARDILTTFARHVDRGLLPNRFPDGAQEPEYNTVDATLWYFQAVSRYLAATRDMDLARELYPVLVGIVGWHDRGTRYGIHTAEDGLLAAGEAGVQLTWMDAKVDGRVITPRTGKAVEINALWHGAFRVLADIAKALARNGEIGRWAERAEAIEQAFNERFWIESEGRLHDVIDGPGDAPPDGSLRPNQIIACALVHPILAPARARRVVDACARGLLTSFGLRSLDPAAPAYVGHYGGSPVERDEAYHQGTAWVWLIGPFVQAHLRAYGDAGLARSFLAPFQTLLTEACAGQLPEILDGDAPHRPNGCTAQAWSVAEVLRAWADTEVSPEAGKVHRSATDIGAHA
jgi:predicted glycogen debranching enzyme